VHKYALDERNALINNSALGKIGASSSKAVKFELAVNSFVTVQPTHQKRYATRSICSNAKFF
jgi:hypothetical protein